MSWELLSSSYPDRYRETIIAREEENLKQQKAYCLFLESFYYTCGFREWHQRADGSDEWKSKTLTPEERKQYVRYDAVMQTFRRIPDLAKREAGYLVGRVSGYGKVPEYDDNLGVRSMAIYLERLSTKWETERYVAIVKVFRWLTGHKSFQAAYEDEEEKREFTDEGVLPASDVFKLPEGIDLQNEELWDNLMREEEEED